MSDQTSLHTSRRDLIAGAIFVLIAGVFGWIATGYEVGRAVQMGPGFIPLAICALLGAFGLTVAAQGIKGTPAAPAGPIPWRGLVLVCAALLIFATYLTSLGLVPVVFLCGFITAMASSQNGVGSAAATALVLDLLCVLVFKLGLRLNVAEFNPAVFGGLLNPISDALASGLSGLFGVAPAPRA